MRIGVNSLFLIPGEVGGTETYLRELTRSLVEGFPQDRYVIFCNRENFRYFDGLGAQVEKAPCPVNARFRPGRILYEQFFLPSAVAERRIDVLWSAGYTMPCRASCANVVTIHDLQHRHFPEDFSRPELWATRALVQMSCCRADHILTASEASAEDIVRLGRVPRERVTAAHYGVATDFFERIEAPHLDSILKELGVERPFILTVANSYPHKNLDRLARAFGLMEERTSCSLVIVGLPRRGEPVLQSECRALRDPKRILRLDRVSRQALRVLYQSAELLAFPTLFEGFGLPVIEAMASGTPVACSRIPCLREVAGDAAEFFNPRDEREISNVILRLLEDPLRRAELSRKGQARAREFSWEKTALATHEVLAQAAIRRQHDEFCFGKGIRKCSR